MGKTLGQIAYEAYAESEDYAMTDWGILDQGSKKRWESIAATVKGHEVLNDDLILARLLRITMKEFSCGLSDAFSFIKQAGRHGF
jgi:hypothetical protein